MPWEVPCKVFSHDQAYHCIVDSCPVGLTCHQWMRTTFYALRAPHRCEHEVLMPSTTTTTTTNTTTTLDPDPLSVCERCPVGACEKWGLSWQVPCKVFPHDQ